MNDEGGGSSVTSDEQLARFIRCSNWFRKSDQTVKQNAFIPHPYPDLSVTRHKNLSEQELWQIGQGIAEGMSATLHGRADIRAAEVRRQALEVEPKPEASNPNHANVINWPVDKSEQKKIALLLAAKANFVPRPQPARG